MTPRPTIYRAALSLLRLMTPEQKAARIVVLRERYGLEFAEAVAAKADQKVAR